MSIYGGADGTDSRPVEPSLDVLNGDAD